ncbi:MAG: hypothetical protein JNM27_15540 [Leptospirales bacterium]|nr:hypothetical protein [Leptospirales bacterium]
MDENLEFNAGLFLELASPFLSKYTFKDDSGWHFCDTRLRRDQIEKAIQGEITLGFFSTHSTRLLIFDVDAHVEGISDARRAQSLIQRALRIIKAMDRDPALAFRTPRGLHLWYLFDYPRSVTLLHAWAASRFQKQTLPKQVELFPQPYRAIRIPAKDCLVDPITMEPRKWDGHLTVESAPDFRAEAPSTFVRKNHRRQLTPMDIARLLNEARFRRGQTNRVLVDLVRHLARGFVPEAVAYELLTEKLSADGYVGDLEGKRLQQRIASLYRDIPRRIARKEAEELPPVLVDYIRELTRRSPFKPKRKERLHEFLSDLFRWVTYLNNLSAGERAERRDKYPYWEMNMRKGWYPIPTITMKQWKANYLPFLNWLLDEGFLITRTSYRVTGHLPYEQDGKVGRLIAGSCRYFEIPDFAVILRGGVPEILNTVRVVVRRTGDHDAYLSSFHALETGALHAIVSSWLLNQTLRDEHSLREYYHQQTNGRLSASSLANFVKRSRDVFSVQAIDPKGRSYRLVMKEGEQLPPGWLRIASPSESMLQAIRQAATFLLDHESRSIDQLKAKTRDFLGEHMVRREIQRNFPSLFKQAMKQLTKSGEFDFIELNYKWNHDRL